MKLKVYLINLKRSAERRKFMENELNSQNMDFEIFDAYDGNTLSSEFINANGIIEEIEKKKMPAGAIGCSFSHVFLYKLITEREDEVILILEDDMRFEKDFARIAKIAASHIKDGEIIFPYFIPKPNCKITTDQEIKIEKKYSIMPFVNYHRILGAGAYMLTKNTALKLYNGLYPICTFADDWNFIYEKGMVNKYKTIYPLISRAANFRSQIGYLHNKPKISKLVNTIQDKTPVLNWVFKLYRKRVANKLRNQIMLTNEKSM